MPRAKEKVKVVVAQLTEGEDRTITVSIVAKAADFVLPDLLSGQGAIDSYADRLSKAAKEATESYLQEATDAVAALAARKQRQVSEPDRPAKQKDNGKEVGPKRVTPAEAGAAQVGRTSAERVNGPVTV